MKRTRSLEFGPGRRAAPGGGRASRCVRAAVAAALLAFASLAAARPVPEPQGAGSLDPVPTARVAQRGSISLEQATAMAAQRFQGRVVRAETKMRGGRLEHEIRILGPDNRVRTVRIDAETGQFL